MKSIILLSKVHRVGKRLSRVGPVGTDNLKGEQCLGKGVALQGWEHLELR